MPALRHRAAHFLFKKAGFFKRYYREKMYGREFVIPIVNGRKAYHSEAWMATIIKRLFALKSGGFVDVGVNLGQTMLKVAAVSPERAYVGFEPNPACSDYAQQLASANGLPYLVIPAGLSSKTGLLNLVMYRNEDTDPSASLVEDFRPTAHSSRSVMVIAPEDLPSDIFGRDIAIIKIDVEGGEAEVIEGIAPIISRQRPFVLVEILPAYRHDNTARTERHHRVEAALSGAGYAMFQIRRAPKTDVLKGVVRIAEIGIENDLALADYLMVPTEDVDLLGDLVISDGGT